MWERITNWKTKFLSNARKEILLNVVLQAILAYAMSIFLLHQNIISKLNGLFQKFLWGSNEDRTKIQWMNWGSFGLPKTCGGLGFRDVGSFNLALLSKQGWIILNNPFSLMRQVFKEKYY